jgi:hypothetical protein
VKNFSATIPPRLNVQYMEYIGVCTSGKVGCVGERCVWLLVLPNDVVMII